MANDRISLRVDCNMGEGRIFFRPDLAVGTIDPKTRMAVTDVLTGAALMSYIDQYDLAAYEKGIVRFSYNPLQNRENVKSVFTKVENILKIHFDEAAV